MASIIEGYEYDIFISYRQKDNKHDGWITEFVDNLKGELESTFKEEISVYFDINPHDGLLETHDVDASLKDKLKCLVFIPITSRTYCDPKSFAWEHEFKAFVEEASKDQFGLKVKLLGGNVASRVLPIRIHDLSKEDISQFEAVTGSILRSIDFIYKESGVNRPLKPGDNKNDNQNRTDYRNQVNKVANAISDIIVFFQDPSKQMSAARHTGKISSSPEPFDSEGKSASGTSNSVRQKKTLRIRIPKFNKVNVPPIMLAVSIIMMIISIWLHVKKDTEKKDKVEYLPLAFEEPYRQRFSWAVTCVLSPIGDKIAYRGDAYHYIYNLLNGKTDRISSVIENNGTTFSPSGDSVVLRTSSYMGTFYVVSLSTGQAKMIADSVETEQPSWSEDGWIYYFQNQTRALMRVRSNGSRKEKIIEKSDDMMVTGYIEPLPGNVGLIYPQRSDKIIDPAASEIIVFNLKTKEKKSLGNGVRALFIKSFGTIIICKADGTLLAGKFDVDKLSPVKGFVKILENVETGGNIMRSIASFTISNNGDLLFITRDNIIPDEILYVDRSGRVINEPLTMNGWINQIDLSSDGHLLLASLHSNNISAPNIWVRDLRDQSQRRITNGKLLDYYPGFTNQDKEVTFISPRDLKNWDLYSIPVDGSHDAKVILDRPGDISQTSFSKDGMWMAFCERNAQGEYDIFAQHFDNDSLTISISSLEADERYPKISPDGKWVAYVSNETSRNDVYVQPFPNNENKSRWQISKDGGTIPAWSNSRQELFYLNAAKDLISVPISKEGGFSYSSPKTLFNTGSYVWSGVITADDKTFLMIKRDLHAPGQVILVKNWMHEVMRKLNEN
jgi:Tol biopolymer transport system component